MKEYRNEGMEEWIRKMQEWWNGGMGNEKLKVGNSGQR